MLVIDFMSHPRIPNIHLTITFKGVESKGEVNTSKKTQ